MTHTDGILTQLRVPPNSLEAERAVLGSIMITNGECFGEVAGMVVGADFYRETHRRIFTAMATVNANKDAIDVVSVGDQIPNVQEVGGLTYLNSLLDAVPTAANVAHYCVIVRRLAVLRALIGIGTEVAAAAFADSTEPEELISRTVDAIKVLSTPKGSDDCVSLYDASIKAFDRIDASSKAGRAVGCVTTGFAGVDALIGGQYEGHLVLVGARPGMGKTAALTAMARANVRQTGGPALYVSREMMPDEIAERILSEDTRIGAGHLRHGRIHGQDHGVLHEAVTRLRDEGLWFAPRKVKTLVDLERLIERFIAKFGKVTGIYLDYLQLFRSGRYSQNRDVELGQITGGLKEMAMDNACPVVAGSQLNRKVEERADKHPQLADLRESGNQEQDANVVVFLYRPWMYDKAADPTLCEQIVAKCRHGRCDTVPTRFLDEYASFERDHTETYDYKRLAAGDRE